MSWCASAADGSTSLAALKAELFQTVTRLNGDAEADSPPLRARLLELVAELAAVNPNPRAAENGRVVPSAGSFHLGCNFLNILDWEAGSLGCYGRGNFVG